MHVFLGFGANIMKPAKFNIIELILTCSVTCSQRCGSWLGAKTTSQMKPVQVSQRNPSKTSEVLKNFKVLLWGEQNFKNIVISN